MHTQKRTLSHELLLFEEIEKECDKIVDKLKKTVYHQLNRRGGVVGISGGIDSSVTLALTVRALGAENVIGIILPESESSSDSEIMAKELAKRFGVKVVVESITPALKGFGCYSRRDSAISNVIPAFNSDTDKSKIVIKQDIKKNIPPIHLVTVIAPDGIENSKMLPAKDYLQIVASSNFKQRSRMAMLYYHAERLYYSVIGTPNRNEIEQGFFVKFGDGGADVMPISNLYKTQVYQLAKYLEVPQEIIDRIPTTDTYSAEQTQEEFFFQLPYEIMDLISYGLENKYSIEEIATSIKKTEEEVINISRNIERKKKTTAYLRTNPIYF
ncbi:MAG: NAD(+) synthase [Dysgonamonadaceae bacterium]|nr:NAD(+) synthase [Dysgonamonadaceae bacterium]